MGTGNISGTGNSLDNVITGNSGDNILIGGGGNDTVSYATATSSVTVSLASSSQNTGGGGFDTLSGFQNIIGSAHEDTLTGTGGNNILNDGDAVGSTLVNTLIGGGGTDIYYVNSTNTSIINTFGVNSAVFSSVSFTLPSSVNFLTLTGTADINGTGNFEGGNVIIGNSGNNILSDGESIFGGDTLIGGGGSNTYIVNSVNFIDDTGGINGTILSSIHITLDNIPELASIRNLTLTGSADLSATGNDFGQIITGNNGSNILTGGSGDDVFVGSGGNDFIDGGGGVNTASYSNLLVFVDINLLDGFAVYDGTVDQLTNIQNLIGTSFDDTILGDDNNNILSGGAGNNFIDGGGGVNTISYDDSLFSVNVNLFDGFGVHDDGADQLMNIHNIVGSNFGDQLVGDMNDNTFYAGQGSNFIDGMEGNNTVSYDRSTSSIDVDLSAGFVIHDMGATDNLMNIQNITGSGFNDTIYGSMDNNIINGGLGDDTIDGGDGVNTVSYASATSGVTIDLSLINQDTGGAGFDTLFNIQNVIGSAYGDTLSGTDLGSVLDGGGTIEDNIDIILGNFMGNDILSFDSATSGVTIDLSMEGATQDTIGGGIVEIFNIHNVIGSRHDDTLTGDSLSNQITGGLGDDMLSGGFDDNSDTFIYDMSGTVLNGNDTIMDFNFLGVPDALEFHHVLDVTNDSIVDINDVVALTDVVDNGFGGAKVNMYSDSSHDMMYFLGSINLTTDFGAGVAYTGPMDGSNQLTDYSNIQVSVFA
jgi:Ca2+-binding RTX toxin-like protein